MTTMTFHLGEADARRRALGDALGAADAAERRVAVLEREEGRRAAAAAEGVFPLGECWLADWRLAVVHPRERKKERERERERERGRHLSPTGTGRQAKGGGGKEPAEHVAVVLVH